MGLEGVLKWKKYDKQDQRSLATWAADCAERALPFFEKVYPLPKNAIGNHGVFQNI
jgi:hypothetical protein